MLSCSLLLSRCVTVLIVKLLPFLSVHSIPYHNHCKEEYDGDDNNNNTHSTHFDLPFTTLIFFFLRL